MSVIISPGHKPRFHRIIRFSAHHNRSGHRQAMSQVHNRYFFFIPPLFFFSDCSTKNSRHRWNPKTIASISECRPIDNRISNSADTYTFLQQFFPRVTSGVFINRGQHCVRFIKRVCRVSRVYLQRQNHMLVVTSNGVLAVVRTRSSGFSFHVILPRHLSPSPFLCRWETVMLIYCVYSAV